ncbi:MAG: winged helix-turn-helix domain-containing protein [Acidobacteria bacterium]|nr:winged helix-turn-helix domain-containing protein [Acidobacteriota bacterium]
MPEPEPPILLRFDRFELDLRTRELRKDGRLVKLQDLPGKLLVLLAGRPGELVTREEIEKALWGEDQFVDFEHGINTAMRKIRDALGEAPEQPRFIETLPRKGYRFIAPVEMVSSNGLPRGSSNRSSATATGAPPPAETTAGVPTPSSNVNAFPPVAVPAEEFLLPRARSRGLFLLIQAGYLAIYCAALYKAESMEEVLEQVYMAPTGVLMPVLLALAMCGIAVRLYLLTSVGLDHPAAGEKYRKLFPVLFVMDTLWAVSPLLLVRKMGFGAALACVAALAYLPFAQRTLIGSVMRSGHGSTVNNKSAG